MTISQPELVGAILKNLGKQGMECAIPRIINACIRAADSITAECATDYRPATPGCGYQAWLASDDTGESSLFMAWVMLHGAARYHEPVHPRDPADLGRCIGLLDAVPTLRGNVPMMTGHGPEWAALASNWAELEGLYREELPSGKTPHCHARMTELLDGAREKSTNG